MDDFMPGVAGGIVLSAIVGFVWWINGKPTIDVKTFNYAIEVCQSNQGFKSVEEGYTRFGVVNCNNGASFEYDLGNIKK